MHLKILTTVVLISLIILSPFQSSSTANAQDTPSEGYTLFAPIASTMTYLIDNEGYIINSWESNTRPGQSVYLLENGNLLRTGIVPSEIFGAGGVGGLVEIYTWDGQLEWSFEYASDLYHLHHDIEMLPNGNILMIAWEYKTADEAIAMGRNPDLLSANADAGPNQPNTPPNSQQEASLWPDSIIEIDPSTDSIVWEWHVWDHLVQDYDSSAPNFGNVSEHPELINLNFVGGRVTPDWTHTNSIDYNPQFDQILLSVHNFNEIWIIDHSTTTQEAASHAGGNSGKGGDLLYRWGNPQAYNAGSPADQQLFAQHNATWIGGLSGEGNILIFNNGNRRNRAYSSVDEIVTPVDADGNYILETNSPSAPEGPIWTYTATPAESFYAMNISGAQRLSNGNTLICNGPSGTFIEVTPNGDIVWEYTNPIYGGQGQRANNAVFRAERYAPDFAGFDGKDLTPGALLAQN